jgi:hypothetical protein
LLGWRTGVFWTISLCCAVLCFAGPAHSRSPSQSHLAVAPSRTPLLPPQQPLRLSEECGLNVPNLSPQRLHRPLCTHHLQSQHQQELTRKHSIHPERVLLRRCKSRCWLRLVVCGALHGVYPRSLWNQVAKLRVNPDSAASPACSPVRLPAAASAGARARRAGHLER